MKRAWPFKQTERNRQCPCPQPMPGDRAFEYQEPSQSILQTPAGLDLSATHASIDIQDSSPNNGEASDMRNADASLSISIEKGNDTTSSAAAVNKSIADTSQIVCYGAVIDVKVQSQIVPELRIETSGDEHEKSLGFDVHNHGDLFALHYEERKFAVFNKKACRDLHLLGKIDGLYLRAHLSIRRWISSFQNPSQSKSPKVITVDLIVCGQKSKAYEVGSVLSNAGTFLQQPVFGTEGFEYFNPHFFDLPTYKAETPDPHKYGSVSAKTTRDPTTSQVLPESSEMTFSIVDNILNSLSQHNLLSLRQVDGRIRTQLLPYQREAVDFIFQRETGPIPKELSLWVQSDDSSINRSYRHIITGDKSPTPEHPVGGILADEMGLGKTLVMLTAIAGSSGDAAKHSSLQMLDLGSSTRRPTRATLIITPSSVLMDSWVDEIRLHTFPGCVSFYKYHGPGREDDINLLMNSDIVLTTYSTIVAESRRDRGLLKNLIWYRITLDEAHTIRNRTTKQFRAIKSLKAQYRWCLTGTPIQNSLDDLGSLVEFLRVPVLKNSTAFRRCVASQTLTTFERHKSSENLRKLLNTICIRRTREILGLPQSEHVIRKLKLSQFEQQVYENILQHGRRTIDMIVSGKGKKKLYSTALGVLLTLRLFCNNGPQQRSEHPDGTPLDPDETLSYLQQHDESFCGYCSAEVYVLDARSGIDGGLLIRHCHHLICSDCIHRYHTDGKICPRCTEGNLNEVAMSDTNITPRSAGENIHSHAYSSEFPSKLLELMTDIENYSFQKSIVFSCWRKTLDLVGQLLDKRNMAFTYIHGLIPFKERGRILERFQAEGGEKILLMTLGTGAEGLNLAAATRIYLLEPQWNPYVEYQAMSRALRLGQTSQVTIIRYITTGTVEESNVLSRQRQKLRLADEGFTKHERLEELLTLLGVEN